MLCSLLARNGAGRPAEHLNPDPAAGGFGAADGSGLSAEAYVESVRRRERVGGIFGTKVMVHWLDAIRGSRGGTVADDAEVLVRLFPDAIYLRLRRLDAVGMAVSHTMALATGEWRGARRSHPPDREITMDEVDANRRWLLACEERWTELLAEIGAVPYEITYEALSVRPDDVVAGILDHIGHDGPIITTVPETTVQRGRAASDLRARYESWLDAESSDAGGEGR
jgi:LPS sulfotransferase NodH